MLDDPEIQKPHPAYPNRKKKIRHKKNYIQTELKKKKTEIHTNKKQ